jgi:DNA repair protein RecO (recombination protein O)
VRIYKTAAIVLHTTSYKEADALLVLYTLSRGRVRALAKGVRRPKSKLRGGVQPLTKGLFALYRGQSLDTVIQCQLEASFPRLHAELARWAHANYLAELVIAAVPEGEGSPELFSLLLSALYLLEEEDPALVARFFELKLLVLLGYLPELERCSACGGEAGAKETAWVGPEGLLCGSCAALRADVRPIGRRELSALRFLTRVRPAALGRLRLDPETVRLLEEPLSFWLAPHLNQPLKTTVFLHDFGLKEVQ